MMRSRSCCAICCADRSRSRRGTSCTLMRARFIDPTPPPVLTKKVSTYGLWRTTSAMRCEDSSMSWNEVPCAACRLMFSESLSSSGTKPFGTTANISIVAAITTANTASIAGRWRSTMARLHS